MSKKSLIILLIALVLVLVGIGILFYYQSFKTVTFNFKNDDFSATVYKQQGEDERSSVASLDKTTEWRLQKGTYIIIPNGAIYSPAPIEFKVADKDITVDINPDFSSTYRNSLLAVEQPAIQSAIKAAYPDIINDFVINSGEIYEQGQWYATTLTQKAAGSDEGDVYRTVLKKEDGTWVIKAEPALVLGSHTYPDIPKEILSSVNAKD